MNSLEITNKLIEDKIRQLQKEGVQLPSSFVVDIGRFISNIPNADTFYFTDMINCYFDVHWTKLPNSTQENHSNFGRLKVGIRTRSFTFLTNDFPKKYL